MVKIIGVLCTKNLLSQGYPFLESIYSFLNFGDYLYIQDGSSDDGTEEILKKLSKNKRIKVFFGYKWNTVSKGGHSIRDAYNDLLSKVKLYYPNKKEVYIMQVQSNEVVHESVYKEIKELPLLYPQYVGFFLPYNFFVGRYLVNSNDWRLRILRLDIDPVVYGDGGAIYPKKELPLKAFIPSYLSVGVRYINRKLYHSRNLEKLMFFYIIAPLSKPVFRYTYIFPKTIKNKVLGHKNLYFGNKIYISKERSSIPLYIIKLSRSKLPNKKFYYLLANKMCNSGFRRSMSKPVFIADKYHPKIMRGILNLYGYKARESLINKIVKM